MLLTCLAPSHYLNQCLLIVIQSPRSIFKEILCEIKELSKREINVKMSSAKWQPFRLWKNVSKCLDITIIEQTLIHWMIQRSSIYHIFNKSNVQHWNTLGCLDQYMCNGLRLLNSRDCELAWTGDELWCRQAQNMLKSNFLVKFDLEGQGRSHHTPPPKL